MKLKYAILLFTQLCAGALFAQGLTVQTANGALQGIAMPSGVVSFKGIPFAAPPVGNLRWREPQPPKDWQGVKIADHFGPQAMQKHLFSDMVFRSAGISEDCLYLNVWTPAKSGSAKLPVLVYFYGGGLVAGDGSEPRYDGESLAAMGIVTVTVNYRLGVFGFFSHPGLTQESSHHSSGNYGYLDQNAALIWVKRNIAAFGGNPDKITIAGESAGSISVASQMASPLSKGLIVGAIGESGAPFFPTLAPILLTDAEKNGVAFAAKEDNATLAELREMTAQKLLDDAGKPGMPPNTPTVDGYFMPKLPVQVFAAGEQAHVPLLVGWNSAEVPYQAFMRAEAPTPENYEKLVRQTYADNADTVLKLYPGANQAQVIESATQLASDRFIVYSTWKWADLQAKTSGQPVYRYLFSETRPPMPGAPAPAAGAPVAFAGAAHASEIEYALGNLTGNTVYPWGADDKKTSATMEAYFANFIKTGNPNSKDLPKWKANTATGKVMYMNIKANSKLEEENTRARYLFLDKQYVK